MATLYRTFQVLNARVEKADGSSSTAIGVKTASITFDWTWAPYVQATLTVAEPSTQAQLLAIEPRSGLRVRFTVRQIDGATTVDRAFDLQLRGRSFDWLTREVTLTVASNEAMLQDWADGADWHSGAQYVDSIVGNAIGLTGVAAPASIGSLNPDYVNDDNVWAAGRTCWDYVGDLVESANWRLWYDETGAGSLTPAAYRPDTTVRGLDEPINVVDRISRDDDTWGTGAVLVYNGNTPPAASSSISGTTPRKIITGQRTGKRASSNGALKIRTNAAKRGRSLDLTVPAQVIARPLQQWNVAYLGQAASGIAQSVTIDLPTGTMRMMLNVIES